MASISPVLFLENQSFGRKLGLFRLWRRGVLRDNEKQQHSAVNNFLFEYQWTSISFLEPSVGSCSKTQGKEGKVR